MSRLLGGAAYSLKSFFARATKDETFQFVRFENEPCAAVDTTEMKKISTPNGTFGVEGEKNWEGDPDWNWAKDSNNASYQEGADDGSGDTEDKVSRNRISEWQAGWNVTNAIQGMFIVTFPYAVLEGGYWAIFSMVIVAVICCYTGKILVDCLYEVNEDGVKVRVRDSYVAIAEEVWGARFGGKIVNVAQIIELLMTCILYVLLCGDLMIGIMPNSPLDLSSWIMVSSALLLPCAFLRSLRHVSWLSFWCTVAHMFINAIIIIYCFTRVRTWKYDQVQIKIDIWTWPISLGIVIFSYTSQIFLPTLEGNLIDRKKFHCMMHWTHIAAAIFKAGFSYIGFVTWGFETKEVITNNLPNENMKIIVNLFLVAKALLSYPLPFYAAVELIETGIFQGKPKTTFPSCFDAAGHLKVWALALRLSLVVFTLFMAIFIPHFAILMGLIGSFTGNMLSLVWPSYFHLRIKKNELTLRQRIADISIILVGFVCAILGVYYSSHALVRAFQGIEPRPFQGSYKQPSESAPDHG